MKKANRYAQLEAQASLLKARLATEKEATYEQALYYFERALSESGVSHACKRAKAKMKKEKN